MNDKTNMRYNGFRSADDGGRIFEFSISATAQDAFLISIEIPSELFVGVNRIQLQEGVAISYAKLKHLLTLETADDETTDGGTAEGGAPGVAAATVKGSGIQSCWPG